VHGGDNEGKKIVEKRYGHQKKIKKRSKDLRQNRSSSSVRVNSSSISWREIARLDYSRHGSQRITKMRSWDFCSSPKRVQHHRLFSLCLSKYTTSRTSTYSCRNTLCINYKFDARKISFLQCKIISDKIIRIQSVQ